jgi:hypothetical protein
MAGGTKLFARPIPSLTLGPYCCDHQQAPFNLPASFINQLRQMHPKRIRYSRHHHQAGIALAPLNASGPKGIRVHAISPGPLATRAASGFGTADDAHPSATSSFRGPLQARWWT